MRKQKLTALLVVPDTNTTMQPEIAAHWPALDEVIRIGIPRPPRPIVASDLPEYRAATLAAVHPYLTTRPDIVLYGCTTAGFLAGPAGDRDMCDALADAAGAPAVTTAYSMVEALRNAGILRPAIVTPYLQASNEGLKRFLKAYDIGVSVLNSLLFTTVEQYNNATEQAVWDIAVPTASHAAADGLFVACTQLPTLGILPRLRETCGKPVWGAIEATAWCGQRALARTTPSH
jgi:maleate cis-trans isomerase